MDSVTLNKLSQKENLNPELITITLIIFLGGLVKGVNGFGYAVVSTPLLATVMPAQNAVAFMILPLIASNIEIIRETDRKKLKNCMQKFSGLYISIVIATTVSMLIISYIPVKILEKLVGVLAIIYVASRIEKIENSMSGFKQFCLRTWEPLIGFC